MKQTAHYTLEPNCKSELKIIWKTGAIIYSLRSWVKTTFIIMTSCDALKGDETSLHLSQSFHNLFYLLDSRTDGSLFFSYSCLIILNSHQPTRTYIHSIPKHQEEIEKKNNGYEFIIFPFESSPETLPFVLFIVCYWTL